MKESKKEIVTATNTHNELKESHKEADKQMIASYKAKSESQSSPPKFKVEQKGEATNVSCDTKDQNLNSISLMMAFGSMSGEFVNHTFSELIDAAIRGNNQKPYSAEHLNAVLGAMHGINPQDEIEAMLASQIVATHFASMRCMRSLKNSDTIQQQDSNGNLAIKLLRTYTAQIEALQRYRGKGQQKMTVEHVHVNAGGQAIIGNVNHSKGGGLQTKTEEQPHAKEIAHAPMQEMPSPNKERQSVPVPCHE